MEIIPLRSGSCGNAALVFTEKTKILVDCGVSGRTAENAVRELGISPDELNAIVVTHEHSDHIKGVGIMMRRYNIPVFANQETWDIMYDLIGNTDDRYVSVFDRAFQIGDIGVEPFSIPHDAANPVGYSFINGRERVSVATDIGELKKELFEAIRGSKTVILEANHDINMLEMGSYPQTLKRRIRGSFGHLSNDDAGKAAEFLVKLGTENIILGHLSQENNYPELAFKTVENALLSADIKCGKDVFLAVAKRDSVLKV